MKALAITSIVLVVSDLARSTRFYHALGFAPGTRTMVTDPGWLRVLGLDDRTVERQNITLGDQHVTLIATDPPGRPYPADSTATDLWFQHLALVVADMPAAHAAAIGAGAVPISIDGPQQLPPTTGSVQAFKFRDPDGHPLELLHFPVGTGDPRWQGASPALFRGIDHSAIAVHDVAASQGFYSRSLGLTVKESTLNHGPAQQRLDGVVHDRVDVVALAPAAATPHLELLGYRTGLRRPLSPEAGPADATATRLLVHVDAIPQSEGVTLASGGRALAWGDPDGHRLVAVTAVTDTSIA